MKVFITGTDTNVGKTVICAWLSYHLNYAYWKPIQSGTIDSTDAQFVRQVGLKTKIYAEKYSFLERVSPHLAAERQKCQIDIGTIHMPNNPNLIIEGAGGIYVPIDDKHYVIDLIKNFEVPVIVIARAGLGTINHSLLTLEALKNNKIPILGVILNEESKSDLVKENAHAIEKYGQVPVLACFPHMKSVTPHQIQQLNIPHKLRAVFQHA